MKKVININFQGSVVPIEESAYDELQKYIDSLRKYFAEEEGREEIINDIESRISELFQQRLKNGATCITEEDVALIINNMGRPADFDEVTGTSQSDQSESKGQSQSNSGSAYTWNYNSKRLYRDEHNKILGGVCSGIGAYLGIDPWIVRILFILSGIGILAYIILWIFVPANNSLVNGAKKKLYRNPDEKIIGGVCSGIGSYFDINPWLPRIIFLLPFVSFIFRWSSFGPLSFPNFLKLTFSPGTLLIYIILWLVIPEAKTTSEKLEMKGEKVDLNSIKNSVLNEMKGVGERLGKMGVQAGEFAKEKGPQMGQELYQSANRTGNALGNIIATLVKVVLYIILGCIAFAIIVAVFSVAIVAIGFFPLKDFIIEDGLQNLLAWGTLIFFIGVPVVGIVTFIIRKLARMKSSNKLISYSFVGLWIIGWVCFFWLLSLVGRDFKHLSSVNEMGVSLSNPKTEYLEVRALENKNFRRRGWFKIEPYSYLDVTDDTAFIGNVNIRIIQSPSDSFEVSYVKMSNGPTRREADKLASLISFSAIQSDSILWMDKAISINTTDKFRNQSVEVTIAVPIGHKIKIDKFYGYRNRVNFMSSDLDDYYWKRGFGDYDFDYGVQYVMKTDGLYNLNGRKAGNEWDSDIDDFDGKNKDSYRYQSPMSMDSLKKQQESEMHQMQRSLDSLKMMHEKQMDKIKDSLLEEKKRIDQKLEKLNTNKSVSSMLPSLLIENKSYPFINFI